MNGKVVEANETTFGMRTAEFTATYVTATIADKDGQLAPHLDSAIKFEISGPGIVATDNGDATDHIIFALPGRKAFNGFAPAIITLQGGAPTPNP